jgi:hypothetical protein
MLSRNALGNFLLIGLIAFGCESDPPTSGGGKAGSAGSMSAGTAGTPDANAGEGSSGDGGSLASGGRSGAGNSGASASSGRGGAGDGGASVRGGRGGAGDGGASANGGRDGAGDGGAPDSEGGSPDDGGAGGAPADDTVTVEVTPEAGGTVTLGGITVDVPPGAVATATEITIRRIDPDTVESLPSGFGAVGPTVALLPHGLTFDVPVTVTLEAGPAPAESVRSVLRLNDEDDTSWETLGNVTFATTSATFETTTFSILVPGAFTTELLHAAGGTAGIGDMVMSGNRIFYAIHQSASVEIRAVNTNGTNPALLASVNFAASTVQGLAATGTTVYFIVSNTLHAVPVGGGSVQTLGSVGSSAHNLYGGRPALVSDGTQLFYTHLNFQVTGLQSFDLAGTNVNTLTGHWATTLVLDGSTLLSNSLLLGGVQRLDKTLDPLSVTAMLPASEMSGFGVVGIVHDATSIYVLGGIGGNTPTFGLWRKPRAGGPAEPMIPPGSLSGESCALLLADPFLYFVQIPILQVTNENPNRLGQAVLGRILKSATRGTATGIAYANPYTVLQDDNFIYYSRGTNIRRYRR